MSYIKDFNVLRSQYWVEKKKNHYIIKMNNNFILAFSYINQIEKKHN